jgi:hypothetical protein
LQTVLNKPFNRVLFVAAGLTVRTIGMARARTGIVMANIVYNMRRLVQISQAQAA